MAYCMNCGHEIPEGTNFCTECGTKINTNSKQDDFDYRFDENTYYSRAEFYKAINESSLKPARFEKFSKFFGIILFILALIDFMSDPPLLTIILSVVIIGNAIYCLSQKYKLKGFTIAALIISVICVLTGIGQAKKSGLLNIPKEDHVASEDTDEMIEFEPIEVESITTPVVEAKEEAKDIESIPIKDEDVEEEKDVIREESGVDANLKEFLDSYEAFMDEYVAFMKKYQSDPGNAIGMLNDYMTILTKYEEFAKKADYYKQDEMSKEDLAYYLDAMTRIEKKMLEAL